MFGFGPADIGNRSLRSGAAMSLFLMKHSSDEIMILGRWKSRAFLDYIRPQVVQWSHQFAQDMISFETFFELCIKRKKRKEIPEPLRKHYKIPKINLDYSSVRMVG